MQCKESESSCVDIYDHELPGYPMIPRNRIELDQDASKRADSHMQIDGEPGMVPGDHLHRSPTAGSVAVGHLEPVKGFLGSGERPHQAGKVATGKPRPNLSRDAGSLPGGLISPDPRDRQQGSRKKGVVLRHATVQMIPKYSTSVNSDVNDWFDTTAVVAGTEQGRHEMVDMVLRHLQLRAHRSLWRESQVESDVTLSWAQSSNASDKSSRSSGMSEVASRDSLTEAHDSRADPIERPTGLPFSFAGSDQWDQRLVQATAVLGQETAETALV